MKKGLIFVMAALTPSALIEAFYVPRFRQAPLDAAYADWLYSVRHLPSVDCSGPCKFHVRDEVDCLFDYLDRREVIMWRYSFFQTLATHL